MNRLFISFLLSMAFVSAFSQPKQGGNTQPMPQTGGISLPASLDGMMQENKFTELSQVNIHSSSD